MYSDERGLPAAVDAGKYKAGTEEVDLGTTKNVKWVAKLGTQTYGNVVVANGRVLIGTNNDVPRDPRHKGDRSILLCLDEPTGALLWQLVVPKLKDAKVNDYENLGLLSSCRVESNRVYVVTSRCEVMCLDLEGMANGNDGPFTDEAAYFARDTGIAPAAPGPKDADIIWVYDLIGRSKVFPHNASNCSPLVWGDYVYACTSNGMDDTHTNVPSPFAPTLIALDKRTGELAGEDDAGIGTRLFHGQWSSPSTATVKGRQLVFLGGGDGFLYAFDAKPVQDGGRSRLKKVWWCDANPPEYRTKDGKPIKYPKPEGPSEINATPVFYKDRVYVAIGQDPEDGEGVGRLICVDATQAGDITRTGILWDNRTIHRSLSTASIDPASGLLFIGDFSGYLYCFDAENGKPCWTHDLKAHIWGSTLVADGKVYCGDEDGDFTIMAATREKKVLSEANFNAPVYSAPVVANGVLYVGTTTHLYALQDAILHQASAGQSAPAGPKPQP